MSSVNDVLVNRRIIVIRAPIMKGSKIFCLCFSRALEKSPIHNAPAPWAAAELYMRVGVDGAKCLSLNSREVTCEHSAVVQDPLTSPCHSDSQHLALSTGVRARQVIVSCFTPRVYSVATCCRQRCRNATREYAFCPVTMHLAFLKTYN